MCLQPKAIPPIPEVTVQVAQAAFPKGNIYIQMRDELGSIYTDDLFAALYPADGQPAISPWRLALVTVMQFAENLSDRQAAEAVRSRIDWKYVLSLDLTDAGFHYSVLSEFRTRLVEGEASELLLDALLQRLQQGGWLKARGQQRTDSTAVLAAVRELNQLEIVGETLRHTLNALATIVPDWLRQQITSAWYERYSERFDEFHLPKEKQARQQLVETIGQDGYHLLERVYAATTSPWLRQVPAVETLRQVWLQQYWLDEGQVKRRQPKEMPPVSKWLRSPYDTEARYGNKGDRTWIGYKVHFTETCSAEEPHVITQVETVPATQQDHHALAQIQADLADKALLPEQQLVDGGYMSAKRIIESQSQHGIDLLGPVHNDPSWQARTTGAFDVSCFQVKWTQQIVICPQGQQSVAWHLAQDAKGEPVVQILFDKATCQRCPDQTRCTRAQASGRSLTLRYPAERHEMVQVARIRQETAAFQAAYHKRAGIEGTFTQTIRNSGLRQTRYFGLRKTHLQHVVTAAATNILRIINWLNNLPLAPTRISRFAALAYA